MSNSNYSQSHAALFSGARVVITGGAGFIGSCLAHRLVGYDAKVTIVDAFVEGCGANLQNLAGLEGRHHLLQCDIGDASAMGPVLDGASFVFDLAGRVSHVDSMTHPHNDLHDNAIAHLSLLELVREHCPKARFVYTGTRGQYGAITQSDPVSEQCLQKPIDVNGAAKSAGEQLVFVYGKAYELPVTSLRLTNTFGPRHQMHNGRHGVLNFFLRQLMDGQTIRLFGGGEQVRDTSYVGDVVDALCSVVATPNSIGEAYNLGGEALSLKRYCELAIEIYGKGAFEVCEFPSEARRIDVGNYVADISKITGDTGWMPRTSIREGLVSTFRYYRKHHSHYW